MSSRTKGWTDMMSERTGTAFSLLRQELSRGQAEGSERTEPGQQVRVATGGGYFFKKGRVVVVVG